MNKKYWLWCGLGLAIIALAVSYVSEWVIQQPSSPADFSYFRAIVFLLSYLFSLEPAVVISMIINLFHIPITVSALIWVISVTRFVFYFLLGALLGWLYGKIKNRNKSVSYS